jgi:2-methylcitrate dehydratase PrpD
VGETETIAQYLFELNYQAIPAKIVEAMKFLLFDHLGVAIGGMKTESGRIAAEFSKYLGGKEEATIIGFGYRVSAPSAAFSNAILSHSIELDDVDAEAYFHFGPPVLSASLAMAERERSSGVALITAVTAGCDVMARLSSALNPSLRDRGFHTTSTCGVFGAAAACGKLLRLERKQIIDALGLAGAQSCGLMEFYGTSMQKRFNPGPAARGGVVSALLAKRGFTGADTILEGNRGFFRAYSDRVTPANLLDGLGKDFPIYVEYKPYSCARPIHNAIDAALELRKKYGIDPRKIRGITVSRQARWAGFHDIKKPRTYHEAQVSLPFSVAVSLVEGKAFLEQYSDERLNDPLIQKLSEMVRIQTLDRLPREVSCRVAVKLEDGSEHVSQVDYPKGSMQNPMTIEEKREKFKNLSSGVLNEEERKRVEEAIFEIEKIRDVSELIGKVVRRQEC